MNHPFLKNLKTFGFYLAAWTIIAMVHFFVVFFYYDQSFVESIADGVIFNTLYCALGIPIWYAVRYSKSGKNNMSSLVFSHLISVIIILFFWLGTSYTLLYNIFPNNRTYCDFLGTSVVWRITSGVMFYLIMIMIYYLIIYYNNLQEKMKNEAKLNEMIKDSELNLLKAQINPHFLFNSLNSVSSLIMTNQDKAQEMVIKLSDFLRYSVSRNDQRFSSLQAELENTRRYLDIEKVRFGAKLEYQFEVSELCLQHQIPVMILQPIYENAVKHGVYESSGQIMIRTRCIPEDCYLTIIVSNNFEEGAPSRKGAGIGLKNIRERLKLIYGSDNLLTIRKEGTVFEATLIFPIK